MKKWTGVLIIVLLIAACIYSAVYFFVIPKTASLVMPFKWKDIVTGEKMESYYLYLGKPNADKDSDELKTRTWYGRKDNYQFYLNIHFDAGSVADSYEIYYNFSNSFFHKTETIKKETLTGNEL